jgi:hypothetical protein
MIMTEYEILLRVAVLLSGLTLFTNTTLTIGLAGCTTASLVSPSDIFNNYCDDRQAALALREHKHHLQKTTRMLQQLHMLLYVCPQQVSLLPI